MTGNERGVARRLDPPVFYGASIVLLVTVLSAALWPEATGSFFQAMQNGIVANGSWYYVIVVAIILLAVIVFSLTRYGSIKLGPDHVEPDYSFVSWFAMMFSAGMGIGLMFFGVSEPVMHFMNPPVGEPGTVTAAREAMKLTFFHWGIHAWAMYAIVALVLAYFGYRHDLPLTIRSALYPIFGEKIYGPLGVSVDVFAILSTITGVATSLGLGVLQINSGLAYLFDLPGNLTVQIILIAGITALATISVVMGLDAGIKRLSEINIVFAVLLLVGILSFGPTVLLLQLFVQNTGDYLADLVSKTFNLYAYTPTDWLGGWTIFYWGWWLAWSPFVGLFIARISRGRTIREFVMGALMGPAAFTLLWMTVFGNSAIELILHQGAASLGEIVQQDQSVALFKFFEYLPGAEVLSFIAVIMVVIFFVTSADSGALVVNMLASNGEDETPVWQRIYWTATIGVTAAVLLVAGGLPSLQTATIASALPFSIALLFAIWGFWRALRDDMAKRDALSFQTVADASIPWEQRLDNLLQFPSRQQVSDFLNGVVLPAMNRFSGELDARGVRAQVVRREDTVEIQLEVYHGDELDFVYLVQGNEMRMPDSPIAADDSARLYWRAEVHLYEGGQDYDVMGWNEEQIVNDILDQYSRHLNYLSTTRD